MTTTTCPKCNYISGDDWHQCKGSCPMPGSPHYAPPIPVQQKSNEAAKTAT